MDKIQIIIVHYNANDCLVECLESLDKISVPFDVHLFDNSDETPFTDSSRFEFVRYYDNTNGELIDLSGKIGYPIYASYTHACAVQYMLDLIGGPVILLDDDVTLKRDITEIIDENYIVVSGTETPEERFLPRFLPHLMYLNLGSEFKFFDKNRISPANMAYDTGGSLYEDVVSKGAPYRQIDPDTYVHHKKSVSMNILRKRILGDRFSIYFPNEL